MMNNQMQMKMKKSQLQKSALQQLDMLHKEEQLSYLTQKLTTSVADVSEDAGSFKKGNGESVSSMSIANSAADVGGVATEGKQDSSPGNQELSKSMMGLKLESYLGEANTKAVLLLCTALGSVGMLATLQSGDLLALGALVAVQMALSGFLGSGISGTAAQEKKIHAFVAKLAEQQQQNANAKKQQCDEEVQVGQEEEEGLNFISARSSVLSGIQKSNSSLGEFCNEEMVLPPAPPASPVDANGEVPALGATFATLDDLICDVGPSVSQRGSFNQSGGVMETDPLNLATLKLLNSGGEEPQRTVDNKLFSDALDADFAAFVQASAASETPQMKAGLADESKDGVSVCSRATGHGSSSVGDVDVSVGDENESPLLINPEGAVAVEKPSSTEDGDSEEEEGEEEGEDDLPEFLPNGKRRRSNFRPRGKRGRRRGRGARKAAERAAGVAGPHAGMAHMMQGQGHGYMQAGQMGHHQRMGHSSAGASPLQQLQFGGMPQGGLGGHGYHAGSHGFSPGMMHAGAGYAQHQQGGAFRAGPYGMGNGQHQQGGNWY